MTRRYRKLALSGGAFAVLIALGAAMAAFTAGAAPFGAQATTTIVSTVTTGSTTVVTTITTTTPPARPSPHGAKRPRTPAHSRKQPRRAVPWHPDGTSHVAFVHVKRVAVYSNPHAKHALLVLRKRDRNGTQRAFLVRETRRN